MGKLSVTDFFKKRIYKRVGYHMKIKLRKILMRIHFGALTMAIMNTLFKNFTTYSLEGDIELSIELLTAISGLTLFFFYLKPFKKINFYFSIYAVITLLSIVTLIFKILFLGFILMIILYPIFPDEKEYEKDGIIISVPFGGFMSRCCPYEIKERKLLIFEKSYGIIESEGGPIDFETISIESTKDQIELIYSTDFDKEMIKKKIINKNGR